MTIKFYAVTSWMNVEKVDISKMDGENSYYYKKRCKYYYKEFLFDSELEALNYCKDRLKKNERKAYDKHLNASTKLEKFLCKYGEIIK